MAQDIYIKFKGDATGLLNSVKRVNTALTSLDRSSRNASAGMSRLQKSSTATSGSILNVKNALLAFAGGALVRGVVSSYTEFENFRTVLTTFLGSSEKANKELGRLTKLADNLPQDLADVTNAFTILTRNGIDTSSKSLTAFSNIATANGKSLTQLGEAVADALTGEFERLKEFGIKVSKENDQFVARIGDQQVALASSSTQLVAQLKLLGAEGGRFGGAAAANANTLVQAFSNLRGATNAASIAFMEGFAPALKEIVKGATEFLKTNKEIIQTIGTGLGAAVKAIAERFTSYATALGLVAVGFVGYKTAMLAATIAQKGFNLSLIATKAALMRTGIGVLVVGFGELVYQISQAIEKNGGFAKTFDDLWSGIKNFFERIGIRFEILGARFEQLGALMKYKWAQVIAFMGNKVAELVAQTGNVLNKAAQLIGMDAVFDTMPILAWSSSLDHGVANAKTRFEEVGAEVASLQAKLAAVGTTAQAALAPAATLTADMRTALSDMQPYWDSLNGDLAVHKTLIDGALASYKSLPPTIDDFRKKYDDARAAISEINRQLRINTSLSTDQRAELILARDALEKQKNGYHDIIKSGQLVAGIMTTTAEKLRLNRTAHEELTNAIVQQEIYLRALNNATNANGEQVQSATAFLVALKAELASVDSEFKTLTTTTSTTTKTLSALETALKSFVVTADQAAASAVSAAASAMEAIKDPLQLQKDEMKEIYRGLDILRDKDLISAQQHSNAMIALEKRSAREIGEIKKNQLLETMKNAGVSNQEILSVTATSMDNIAKMQQGGVAGAIGLADQMGTIFGALGQQNRKAFEMAKKFNIASAIMNTALAATNAFARVPPPFNFLAAGAVIAAGFAQVAMIRSQQYSGRKLGGPVMGGSPYMVGENGAEMFVPAQSGSIVRNDQMGGGEPITVNFNIQAVDTRGIDQLLIERKSVITSIISDAMLERGQRSRF